MANASASIRYTSDGHWVIMRGEALGKPDSPGFSCGDACLAWLNQRAGGKGNPETLIRAGVNHHMTLAVHQIATLPNASSAGRRVDKIERKLWASGNPHMEEYVRFFRTLDSHSFRF